MPGPLGQIAGNGWEDLLPKRASREAQLLGWEMWIEHQQAVCKIMRWTPDQFDRNREKFVSLYRKHCELQRPVHYGDTHTAMLARGYFGSYEDYRGSVSEDGDPVVERFPFLDDAELREKLYYVRAEDDKHLSLRPEAWWNPSPEKVTEYARYMALLNDLKRDMVQCGGTLCWKIGARGKILPGPYVDEAWADRVRAAFESRTLELMNILEGKPRADGVSLRQAALDLPEAPVF